MKRRSEENPTLRVLVIEDSDDDTTIILRQLRREGYQVEHGRAESAASMREALTQDSWDIIICDHKLPAFDSFAALKIAQESDSDLPFIVVSGKIGEELAVEIMRAGADDYIMKDRLKRLGPAVERELRRVEETRRKRELEKQLQQSHKMEAMGVLAGGIAHDLNNLLYPILMHANLLLEKVDANSQEYADLNEITDAAQLAKNLVSQVLIYSRHGDDVKHVRDVVPIIKDAMKLVSSALPAKIAIESKITNGIMPVLCDSTQLYEVLMNICSNSGHAMSGGGKIEITLDASEIAGIVCFDGTELYGNYCRLTVTDNGIGMDDEMQAKLFDPFFTTREMGRGTGLGLSVVSGIVQNHGGGIKVSSEVDKGTTIEVFLPISEGPVEKQSESRANVQDYAGTENILFVDDEISIRKGAKICLERIGYNVTAVADGQEALDIFAKDLDRFDMVVTDLTMHTMTGEELANALLELRPDIPIILCTGHIGKIAPERVKALGINAILQKPLTPKQLRQAVRAALVEASI